MKDHILTKLNAKKKEMHLKQKEGVLRQREERLKRKAGVKP